MQAPAEGGELSRNGAGSKNHTNLLKTPNRLISFFIYFRRPKALMAGL